MIDTNAVLAAAAAWVWLPPGTEQVERDDYHLIAMPDWTGVPTQVLRTTTDRPAAEVVDEVSEQVRRWGRPWVSWWISGITRPAGLEDHLVSLGATSDETVAVLARTLDGDLPAGADLEVRECADIATLRDSEDVASRVFGDGHRTDEELEEYLASREPDRGTSFVGYLDGRPVTTAGVSLADGFGRMWGGSTLEEARGRGAYSALLGVRMAWARDRGAEAALVKARVGTSAPILRRLGFEEFGQERSYRLPVQQAV